MERKKQALPTKMGKYILHVGIRQVQKNNTDEKEKNTTKDVGHNIYKKWVKEPNKKY